MFLMYTVKVEVDGPPGQKVSLCSEKRKGQRVSEDSRICTTPDHPECCLELRTRTSPCPGVPFSRTTMLGYISIFTCNVFKHFSVFACLKCYSLYVLELLQQDKYHTHG